MGASAWFSGIATLAATLTAYQTALDTWNTMIATALKGTQQDKDDLKTYFEQLPQSDLCPTWLKLYKGLPMQSNYSQVGGGVGCDGAERRWWKNRNNNGRLPRLLKLL